MFTYKWLYRPGKNNVADPLSRNPAVVSAVLPAAGSISLGSCAALRCQGNRQKLTFKWAQAKGGAKVSEPLPAELMASCAAFTRSQVSKPSPVPLPASEPEVVAQPQESEPDLPSVSPESEPESSVSNFQQRWADAYCKDPDYASYSEHYTELDGLWYLGDKLVIPDADALRQYVLCELHDSPHSGHHEFKKTRKAVERYYTWPSLIKDVEHYVLTCPCCQGNKSSNQKPGGLLQPLPIPTRRWGSVSMDLIASLPETAAGNTAIVVFVCRLTTMVHLVACKSAIGAEAFAKLLRHEVLRLHGNMYETVSDRDGRFTSKCIRKVCRLLNIRQAMSSAYHPQTDGQTERTNRVLEDMLRHYVSPTHHDWDEHLDMAEFAINDAWHESVQETPFMLNHGQHPLNFLSLQTHAHKCHVPAAAAFTTNMQLGTERAIAWSVHSRGKKPQLMGDDEMSITRLVTNSSLALEMCAGRALVLLH